MLTNTGMNAAIVATAMRPNWLDAPNIVFRMGASATIGITARAATSGVSIPSIGAPVGGEPGQERSPSERADDEPDEGVGRGHQHVLDDDVQRSDELGADRGRARQHARGGCEDVDDELHSASMSTPTTTGATKVAASSAERARRPAPGNRGGGHRSFALSIGVPCSASRTAVTRSKNAASSRRRLVALVAESVVDRRR